jgi:hypothetical protein
LIVSLVGFDSVAVAVRRPALMIVGANSIAGGSKTGGGSGTSTLDPDENVPDDPDENVPDDPDELDDDDGKN